MKSRLLILFSGLCLLFGSSFNEEKENIPLKNKLVVPIYFKYGLSIGYDDNVFRFSENEKSNENLDMYMGNSKTYDSAILKPELRILYSPYLFKNKITNFIFYSSLSNYNHVKDKNSFHYALRFEYKLGPYNWFKIGYKSTRGNFLRYYSDRDLPGNDYVKCSYDSEGIYMNYSFGVDKTYYDDLYAWTRIEISQKNHFFNPAFTEFDLKILGFSINRNIKYKDYSFGWSYYQDKADNISYLNGLNSSSTDRSYKTKGVKVYVKKKINKFLNQIKLGGAVNKRSYLSENSDSDILHAGRSHTENSFFMTVSKKLKPNINIEFKYTITKRKTNSDLQWYDTRIAQDFDIDALKSFKENHFLIKFTYDMDIDLFY